MQLVVCGVSRPVQLEKSEQNLLVILESTDRREAIVLRAHAAPHGACDTWSPRKQVLANEQQGGDSPVEMLVEGGLPRTEWVQDDGGAAKVHHGGQPGGG